MPIAGATLTALYPSATPAQAAAAAANPHPATAAPVTAAPAQPTEAPPVQATPEPKREASVPVTEAGEESKPPAAEALYANSTIETRTLVKWDEPPAAAKDITLQAPLGEQSTPEILADRAQLIQGLSAAGVGQSTAAEMWQDAIVANTRPITTTTEQCVAELRGVWGDAADARLAVAREMVKKVAAHYPGVTDFLNRTGLGNSPTFIRKVYARAAALENQRR